MNAGEQAPAELGDRSSLVTRLHRIEGQVRGLERMVGEERTCVDVLTQIAAVTLALESLATKLLEDHVNRCVADALASGDSDVAEAKTRELLDAVRRFSRSR